MWKLFKSKQFHFSKQTRVIIHSTEKTLGYKATKLFCLSKVGLVVQSWRRLAYIVLEWSSFESQPVGMFQLEKGKYLSGCLRSGILQWKINIQLDRLGQKIMSTLLFIWTAKQPRESKPTNNLAKLCNVRFVIA